LKSGAVELDVYWAGLPFALDLNSATSFWSRSMSLAWTVMLARLSRNVQRVPPQPANRLMATLSRDVRKIHLAREIATRAAPTAISTPCNLFSSVSTLPVKAASSSPCVIALPPGRTLPASRVPRVDPAAWEAGQSGSYSRPIRVVALYAESRGGQIG